MPPHSETHLLKFSKMVSRNITTQNVIRKHAEQESSFFYISLNFSVSYICTTESGTKRGRGLGLVLVPALPHRPTPPTAHRPPSLSLLFGLSVPAQRGPPHPRAPPLPPAQAQLSASPGQTRHQTTHAASGTVASCCYATLLPIKSQSFSSETRGKIKRIIKSTRDTHYTYHSQTLGLCAGGLGSAANGGWVGGWGQLLLGF